MNIDYHKIFHQGHMVDFYKNLAKEIVQDEEEISRLVNAILEDRDEDTFYPSWLFCHVFDLKKSIIIPHLNTLIKFVPKTKHHGAVRSILRCIAEIEAIHIEDELDNELLNLCYNCFEDLKVDIAIRVHAMQIIFNYCSKYPDLRNDFKQALELQLEQYELSTGYKNRANKLLTKLNKVSFR